MSDTNPLDAVVAALTRTVEGLQGELGQLRQAFTDAEHERNLDPDEEIAEQAKRAGLSVAQFTAALQAGRRAKFREDYADEIRAIVAEGAPAGPPVVPPVDPPTDSPAADDDGSDDDDDSDDTPPAPPKRDDSSPVGSHWSSKPITELLGFK